MAKHATIRCIIKDDRQNPYEAIQYVGGISADGTRWKQTQKQTVQEIDSGEWSFDSLGTDGVKAKVITATSRFGHRYIKTEPDKDVPDNLLSLPTCQK
jgi:hypothetical protein